VVSPVEDELSEVIFVTSELELLSLVLEFSNGFSSVPVYGSI